MKGCFLPMYSILIVDDEPHVLDALQTLLEEQTHIQVDLYRAESGKSAIEILAQINIDLLISDVRMPDIDGLTLLEYAVKLRPFCRVMFLTAYPCFEYAYEGMRKGLVSYVLKTEDDVTLLTTIEKTLKSVAPQREIIKPLTTADFDNKPLWSICFPSSDSDNILNNLMPYINANYSSVSLEFTMGSLALLNVQFNGILFPNSINIKTWIQSVLNNVEHRLTRPAKIACIYFDAPPKDMSSIESLCTACMNRRISDSSRFIYICSPEEALSEPIPISPTKNTANFIMNYVKANINSEITLLRLSQVTGYTPDYLSEIFRKETGESFKSYLNRCKLERVKELMADETYTIDEISTKLAFCTRSYFNRFIKRETGFTPKQLRQSILDGLRTDNT